MPKPVQRQRERRSPRSSRSRPPRRRARRPPPAPADAGPTQHRRHRLASKTPRRPRGRRAPTGKPPPGSSEPRRSSTPTATARASRTPTAPPSAGADGQGAAVRQSRPRRPPTPPAAISRSRTPSPADHQLPELLLRRAPPGAQPVHAEAAQGGSIVVAGTILGRIGAAVTARGPAPDVHDPAGRQGRAARSTPSRSSTAGSCWRRPRSTAPPASDPFFGPGAKNPTVGQVLLMSKEQLTDRVLQDPHVQIYACGRRDIEAGLIDRRVLATIEFLSASGLDPVRVRPRVRPQLTGADRRRRRRRDRRERRHLARSTTSRSSATRAPARSPTSRSAACSPSRARCARTRSSATCRYKGQTNTLALPDHKNRIQITFTPDYGTNGSSPSRSRASCSRGSGFS